MDNFENENTENYLVDVTDYENVSEDNTSNGSANVVVGLAILGAATVIGGISYGAVKLGKRVKSAFKSVKSKMKKDDEDDFENEDFIE